MSGCHSIFRKSVWLWVALYPLMGLNIYDALHYSRTLTNVCLALTAAYAIGGLLYGVFIYKALRANTTAG
jgi:hypothetical protein